jgi:hypothetical protein
MPSLLKHNYNKWLDKKNHQFFITGGLQILFPFSNVWHWKPNTHSDTSFQRLIAIILRLMEAMGS